MARETLDARPAEHPCHDPLTGAPNRGLLLEILKPVVALARRNARGLAVLHVRLNGGPRGLRTALLQEAAEALREDTRDCDVVARVSDHDYVVALTEVWEPDAAARVAHRVYRSLRSLDDLNEGARCHIGVAFFPTDGDDGPALLAAAEAATPLSRPLGFANPAVGHEALRRAGLVRDLEGETTMARFELHYQPIRGLDTGTVVGAESLLRWDRGATLLPAADFIQLAVESGRIRAIDRWSTERAFRDVAAWRSRGWNGWVSVNLSSRSLTDPTLVDVVEGLMVETGAPADAVVFEITEGGALAGDGTAIGVLEGLRALGSRIAVDDFGTGYASFEYLCDFDPDVVKLDRTFLRRGGAAGGDRLLSVLVDVAHRLGKPVVVEGVEDPEGLRRALDTDCEMAQGYFLGRPMAAHAFVHTQIDRQGHRGPGAADPVALRA